VKRLFPRLGKEEDEVAKTGQTGWIVVTTPSSASDFTSIEKMRKTASKMATPVLLADIEECTT
jgi:hypothetical protein